MSIVSPSKTRSLVFAGLCAAIGIVLPMAFHGVPNGGGIFLPMHIPVLLCGFLCGGWYGLACGALTPLVSSLATGMPPAPVLPGMLCELAVYGLVSGLVCRKLPVRGQVLRIYAALFIAMLAGRAVSGLTNGFLFRAGQYTLQAWVSASFVTALPGIVIQLAVVPALVFGLEKAKVIQLSA